MQTPDQTNKIVLPSSGLAEDILAAVSGAPDPAEAQVTAIKATRAISDEVSGESLHLVSFMLNREEYALDISQVQEIIKLSGWTRVPNAPRHVKGVINLRGRIIPVIDPKLKMGLHEAPFDGRNARIIIVEAGGRVIGMAVDSVNQVLRLPSDVMEPPPDTVTGVDDGYIKGVGKLSGRIIILLNVEKVLGKDEMAA